MSLSPVATPDIRVVVRVDRETFTLDDPRGRAEAGTYAHLAMGAIARGDFEKARRFAIRGALARDFLLSSAEVAARVNAREA